MTADVDHFNHGALREVCPSGFEHQMALPLVCTIADIGHKMTRASAIM